MNKRNLLRSLLVTTALVGLGSLAYAQIKPINIPSYPKPPSLKVPPGVQLSTIRVKATCGGTSTVEVKLSYSKIISPEKVWLWGSLGQHGVDIPTGTGSKTVTLAGPSLTCDGPSQNFWAVFYPYVVLGSERAIVPLTFEGFGDKSFPGPG
jgi:hypothetical protein